MKRLVGAMVVGTALLSGCGGNNPPTPSAPSQKMSPDATNKNGAGKTDSMNDVVATVSGEPITMQQLVDPLIEAHGLTMLVNLVELELAKQEAAKAKYHIVVTEKDFAEEHDRTLEKMFKESDDAKLLDALDKAIAAKDAGAEAKIRAEIKLEREDYLAQFLLNQHVDPVEFDIVLKINTYLRKILEIEWNGKITEKDVQAAFGQMYGERVKVEYIELQTMNEVIIAQRRLQNGDKFEQVAKDMSHDPKTAPLGGELPPFSREVREDKVAPVFRDTAFNLRDGQVSDVVAVGSVFMLIKRIEAIAPQAVKYEPVDAPSRPNHDLVYKKLYDTLMEAGLKGMKKQLGAEARVEMKIINPVLARQLKENTDRQAKAQQKARDELDRQQHMQDGLKLLPGTRPADTQPTPGTPPATGAAPEAATAPAGERPPATEPGSIHPFTLPRLGPDTQPASPQDVNK